MPSSPKWCLLLVVVGLVFFVAVVSGNRPLRGDFTSSNEGEEGDLYIVDSCSCYCPTEIEIGDQLGEMSDEEKLEKYRSAGCKCFCLQAPDIVSLAGSGHAPLEEGSGDAEEINNGILLVTDLSNERVNELPELEKNRVLQFLEETEGAAHPNQKLVLSNHVAEFPSPNDASVSPLTDPPLVESLAELNHSVDAERGSVLAAANPMLKDGPPSYRIPNSYRARADNSCDRVKCLPGLPGQKGELGPRGGRGSTGQMGHTGYPGATGSQGQVGPRGIRGPHGRRGPEGLQGIEGPRGSEGPRGIQGIAGPPGQKGEPGAPTAGNPPGRSFPAAAMNMGGKQNQVAFQVRLHKHMGPYTDLHHVIFETIDINDGNHFKPMSGAFVCPLNGTYAFYLNVMVFDRNSAWASIDVNAMPTGYVMIGGMAAVRDMTGSTMQLLHLKRGDIVNVVLRPIDNPPNYLYAHHTSFSGFLLYPD